MLTRRAAILLPALFAVSACQRPTLRVRMTGPVDAAWISARDGDGFFGLFAEVAIGGVTVHATDGARETETMWEVYSEQRCRETPRRVQYGVLPAGFAEAVAPRALSEGATYVLTVGSCGNQGFMYFTADNGRVRPA